MAGEERSVAPTEVRTGEGKGIVSGGIVGGLLGAAAALLIPGIGPAVAGGTLAATLGGAAIEAVTGGILGVFADMGIPEHEAPTSTAVNWRQASRQGWPYYIR